MIKHKIIIAILFTFLASGLALLVLGQEEQSAGEMVAMSPKDEKRKEKEERRQMRRERRKQRYLEEYEATGKDKVSSTAVGSTAANTNFKYPPTVIKSRYRVDVMAYMYLDELVQPKSKSAKDVIPEKAQAGVSVYQGASIAADSLKRAGYNIDIYIHDVTTKAERLDSLIGKGQLDSTDLIIGALQGDDIATVAGFAKSRKINFVSAFSMSDGDVKGNKYFTMLQPSLKTHCRRIVKDIASRYPGMKVTLLYRSTSTGNEEAYNYIIAGDDINFRQHMCKTLPSKEELITFFDESKPNVVIIPVLEVSFADSLLRRLSKDFPTTHFEVYGMHTWGSIKGLRKEDGFPNLSVNIPAPNMVDANSPAAKYVARQYKEFFGGKASGSVYYAYETMMWYASLLKQYGTMFNTNYSDNTAAPFTKFEIKQLRDADGYILYNENRRILLTRYEGGVSRTQ